MLVMLTPEERALLIDMRDRLIELLVECREAEKASDQERNGELRAEINQVTVECDQLRYGMRE